MNFRVCPRCGESWQCAILWSEQCTYTEQTERATAVELHDDGTRTRHTILKAVYEHPRCGGQMYDEGTIISSEELDGN